MTDLKTALLKLKAEASERSHAKQVYIAKNYSVSEAMFFNDGFDSRAAEIDMLIKCIEKQSAAMKCACAEENTIAETDCGVCKAQSDVLALLSGIEEKV